MCIIAVLVLKKSYYSVYILTCSATLSEVRKAASDFRIFSIIA